MQQHGYGPNSSYTSLEGAAGLWGPLVEHTEPSEASNTEKDF